MSRFQVFGFLFTLISASAFAGHGGVGGGNAPYLIAKMIFPGIIVSIPKEAEIKEETDERVVIEVPEEPKGDAEASLTFELLTKMIENEKGMRIKTPTLQEGNFRAYCQEDASGPLLETKGFKGAHACYYELNETTRVYFILTRENDLIKATLKGEEGPQRKRLKAILDTFTYDDTPPEVLSVQPVRAKDGLFLLKNGKPELIVKIREEGSGVDLNGATFFAEDSSTHHSFSGKMSLKRIDREIYRATIEIPDRLLLSHYVLHTINFKDHAGLMDTLTDGFENGKRVYKRFGGESKILPSIPTNIDVIRLGGIHRQLEAERAAFKEFSIPETNEVFFYRQGNHLVVRLGVKDQRGLADLSIKLSRSGGKISEQILFRFSSRTLRRQNSSQDGEWVYEQKLELPKKGHAGDYFVSSIWMKNLSNQRSLLEGYRDPNHPTYQEDGKTFEQLHLYPRETFRVWSRAGEKYSTWKESSQTRTPETDDWKPREGDIPVPPVVSVKGKGFEVAKLLSIETTSRVKRGDPIIVDLTFDKAPLIIADNIPRREALATTVPHSLCLFPIGETPGTQGIFSDEKTRFVQVSPTLYRFTVPTNSHLAPGDYALENMQVNRFIGGSVNTSDFLWDNEVIVTLE